jgi:hypothetical protein
MRTEIDYTRFNHFWYPNLHDAKRHPLGNLQHLPVTSETLGNTFLAQSRMIWQIRIENGPDDDEP